MICSLVARLTYIINSGQKTKKRKKIFLLISQMVAQAGIEPATQGFSVPCSTN